MAKIPQKPGDLSEDAGRWWQKILRDYDLDSAGLLLLANALSAYDRMKQAQIIIKAEGILAVDRFGQTRPHPATLIERDAKQTMLRNLKSLGLEVEPR